MVLNSTNIHKNEQSLLILTEITEHKKTTTYDVGNPDPELGQAGAKHVTEFNRLMGSHLSTLPPPCMNKPTYIYCFL